MAVEGREAALLRLRLHAGSREEFSLFIRGEGFSDFLEYCCCKGGRQASFWLALNRSLLGGVIYSAREAVI